MGRQYAVSISDIMSTYSYGTTQSQDNAFVEIVTGTINAEIERTGARYVDTIYINNRPAILIFERKDKDSAVRTEINKRKE